MIFYRIAQEQYIRDLSGYGSFLYGGRWTLKGTHAIYAASTKSLAYLEFLVHQFERDTWPLSLNISTIAIHGDPEIARMVPEDLPSNWKNLNYQVEIQYYATRFFSEGFLGIQVPSVLVSEEENLILNPKHPDFKSSVAIRKVEKLELDKRFSMHRL